MIMTESLSIYPQHSFQTYYDYFTIYNQDKVIAFLTVFFHFVKFMKFVNCSLMGLPIKNVVCFGTWHSRYSIVQSYYK
jgi:hypothetical protein